MESIHYTSFPWQAAEAHQGPRDESLGHKSTLSIVSSLPPAAFPAPAASCRSTCGGNQVPLIASTHALASHRASGS